MKKIEISEDFFTPAGDRGVAESAESAATGDAMAVILGTRAARKIRRTASPRKPAAGSDTARSGRTPPSSVPAFMTLPLLLAGAAMRFWASMIRGIVPRVRS